MNEEHVQAVCKPGKKEHCCRFLLFDANGWDCAKLTALRATLDRRAEAGRMTARGDNCEGRER